MFCSVWRAQGVHKNVPKCAQVCNLPQLLPLYRTYSENLKNTKMKIHLVALEDALLLVKIQPSSIDFFNTPSEREDSKEKLLSLQQNSKNKISGPFLTLKFRKIPENIAFLNFNWSIKVAPSTFLPSGKLQAPILIIQKKENEKR